MSFRWILICRDDPEKMSITKDSPQKKPKIQTEEKKAVAINTLGSGDLDIREQDVEDVQSKTHVYSSQKCEDREDRCRVWAQTGECLSNAAFMFPTCPQSCGDCLHFTSPKLKAHAKVKFQPSSWLLSEYIFQVDLEFTYSNKDFAYI